MHPFLLPRRPIVAASSLVVLCALLGAGPALAQASFSKSFSPATIGPGSVTTLTFVINAAESQTPLTALAFEDVLPAGVTIASPAIASTSCTNGLLSAPAGGTTITFSEGSLPAGSSCTVVVNVTSATAGTHTNVSGPLTSSAGDLGTATADLTVDPGRPGFTKSFSPASVAAGETSTLTLTIDNAQNQLPADQASFTDTLPAGLLIATPANASTSCTGGIFPPVLTANPGTNVVSLAWGFAAAGSTCSVSVDVLPTSAGLFGNLTGVLSSTRGNSARASATLAASLGFLSKAFVDDPVAPGGTVTLRFTLIHNDRVNAATGITFTDDLDATLSGLVATGLPLANPCGTGSQLTGTSVLTLTGGNLPPEGSCSFDVTLQVPAGAASGVYPNTTSNVSAIVGGDGVVFLAATDSLVVQPIPRLTKSFTDDPVVGGGTVTLEFTLTNGSSTDSATGISFTDNLSAMLSGTTVNTLPAAGFCGAGSTLSTIQIVGDLALSLTGGNLPAGGSCTFSVVLNVPMNAPAGGRLNTTSFVTATVGESTYSGTPATDTLRVVGAPGLTKTFTDDPVLPGGTVMLQFTLTSADEDPAGPTATAVSFTDDLATVLPGLTAIGLPLNDVCGTGSQISGTTNLTFTGGTLASGASCTFSVTLQVPAGAVAGSYPNTTSAPTATVSGLATTGRPAIDALAVAGLSLTKQFTDDPALPGGTVTLQFTLANASPSLDVMGATFTDDLNAALAGLTAAGLPMNDVCGAGSQLSGTTLLTLTGGNLLASASCTFSVTLQVPAAAAAGEYTNVTSALTATVGGSPATLPPASDVLTVANPLTIAKAFPAGTAVPGATTTLEFTVTNASATDAATGISFTDDLDAALSGLVATGLPANDVCGAGSQISGTSLLSLTGGNLAAGASCTFSVTLQVPAGAPAGSFVTNVTSTVTGTVGGVGATGNAATAQLSIIGGSLTKAFGSATGPGGTTTLSFTVTNASATQGLVNVSFTDDLSAVLTGLVAAGLPANDVCGAGSVLTGPSLLALSNGSLPPGGSCLFTVTLQVPGAAAPGSYPNTTSDLSSAGLIVGPPATAMLDVVSAPLFTKVFAPATVLTGQVTTLTFTVDNTAGTVSATSLAFTDSFPAGLVVATPASASTTCIGGTFTAVPGSGTVGYSGGTVAAGASCTLQVDVAATAAGALVNTTGPLTSSLGPSGTATASLNVSAPPPLFAKSFVPATIAAGGITALTFTIDNSSSPSAATGIAFTDNLPAGMTVATPANASTTCTGGTLTAVPGSGVVSYAGGTVAAASSCVVQATVTFNSIGSAVNTTGDLTSSLGSSGAATATLTVQVPAEASIPALGLWGLLALGALISVAGAKLAAVMASRNG